MKLNASDAIDHHRIRLAMADLQWSDDDLVISIGPVATIQSGCRTYDEIMCTDKLIPHNRTHIMYPSIVLTAHVMY